MDGLKDYHSHHHHLTIDTTKIHGYTTSGSIHQVPHPSSNHLLTSEESIHPTPTVTITNSLSKKGTTLVSPTEALTPAQVLQNTPKLSCCSLIATTSTTTSPTSADLQRDSWFHTHHHHPHPHHHPPHHPQLEDLVYSAQAHHHPCKFGLESPEGYLNSRSPKLDSNSSYNEFDALSHSITRIVSLHPHTEIDKFDFNIHNSSWIRHPGQTTPEGRYAEIFPEANTLTQLVNEPMKIPDAINQKANTLDLFLTSHPGKYTIKELTPLANVKGGRNERTSSFFDIPAVTHPYCYRFPSTTPTGMIKKNDDANNLDVSFGSNSPTLAMSHHFHHHTKIEHPDSTTATTTATAVNNLNALHPAHLTTAKSPENNYSSYNSGYSIQRVGESSTVSSSESEIKFENAYNPSSYTLRPVESSLVSSTESDIKFENLYTSSNPISSNTINQRRGSLQLWQFLVALLDEPSTSSSCIAWTGRGMEFKLIEPEEVARRWGIQKNRPAMNYDKLSRSLRYYYEKGIMQKVNGERYVYRFVCDPEALFNMAYGHLNTKGQCDSHFMSASSMKPSSGSLDHMTSGRDIEHTEEKSVDSLYYGQALQNKY